MIAPSAARLVTRLRRIEPLIADVVTRHLARDPALFLDADGALRPGTELALRVFIDAAVAPGLSRWQRLNRLASLLEDGGWL